VRVGDGRRADLEIALGLSELLGNRRFLRARERERVLRREHIEVGLRHPHDEILARLAEGRLGLPYLLLSLLELVPVLQAEDGLGKGERVALDLRRRRKFRLGAVAGSRDSESMRDLVTLPVRPSVGSRSERPCGSFSRPASSVWRAPE